MQVEWASNEKVAIEMAFGASLAGMRSLLCVKSVGLNIALDPLMAFNLSGCNAGLVLLVGDDPGGWGSQNEQDSRQLALAAEVPLLEPTSVSDARAAMSQAFQLSEETGLPIVLRIPRPLSLAEGKIQASEVPDSDREFRNLAPPLFRREFMRWVVLPINVVPYHLRLEEQAAWSQPGKRCGRYRSQPAQYPGSQRVAHGLLISPRTATCWRARRR